MYMLNTIYAIIGIVYEYKLINYIALPNCDRA